MEPVTEEDFKEWVQSPVTKKFFRILVDEREEMKEGLVNGNYENEEMVKGRCQALALILDIDYKDLYK